MRITGDELERARAATENLLEELGVEAYLFQVEPRDGHWEVGVECAVRQGWQRTVLRAGRERLLESWEQGEIRDALLEEWGRELEDCRKEGGG
ncbi:hypothetical protein AN478_09120 [Thiohalorhabdus denitrificans]|uniref:Uncharacterized protein n=1 Tax=Thiohalorhabdus denitrificans TaxID=381306 RepID=A0A0N8PN15_9GAMM|nr:hypothetical protein [Thiohalorhabdus denitrificans]KPV40261.1 hypothetical protein AN478_09120 [Thiohalorhabdus denitrificans]SCX82361.1 hypothetical protein SAMN05661077_0579 [Thiohalorhabdus denitrificans]